jgi:hypothetical protein
MTLIVTEIHGLIVMRDETGMKGGPRGIIRRTCRRISSKTIDLRAPEGLVIALLAGVVLNGPLPTPIPGTGLARVQNELGLLETKVLKLLIMIGPGSPRRVGRTLGPTISKTTHIEVQRTVKNGHSQQFITGMIISRLFPLQLDHFPNRVLDVVLNPDHQNIPPLLLINLEHVQALDLGLSHQSVDDLMEAGTQRILSESETENATRGAKIDHPPHFPAEVTTFLANAVLRPH